MNDLGDLLRRTCSVFYENHTEFQIRCKSCGDSRDSSHAHLYISKKEPYAWHCKICDIAGSAMTVKFLRDNKIYDLDGIEFANNNEKKFMRGLKIKKLRLTNGQPLTTIPRYGYGMRKLQYLNDRIGVQFTEDDVPRLRIITNFKEFLKFNKIDKLSYHEQDVDDIHRNYLGFLSADGSFITFRDVSGKYQRYIDYQIFPNAVSDRTYRIATEVDLLNPSISVVMAEGIISLLGAIHHCEKPKTGNVIYSACQGKGFGGIINNIVKLGFLKQDVTIYSDNDVKERFFQKLKAKYPSFKFNIAYNKIEDDFGHTKDKIKTRIMVL
jgi:hypothetical protein